MPDTSANSPHDATPVDRTCDRCGYSLAGLPPVGACPECGLQYDPHSTCINMQRRRSRHALKWLVPMGVLFGSLMLVIVATGHAREVLCSPQGIHLWLGPFWGWFAYRQFVYSAEAVNELRLNRSGIAAARPQGITRVPWQTLQQAKMGPWGVLRLVDEYGRKLLEIPAGHIGGSREVRRLAEEINAKRAAYLADPETPASVDALITCQRCDHWLHQAPPVGECPQCGLPYDSAARWYRLQADGRWSQLGGITVVAVFFVILTDARFAELSGPDVWPRWVFSIIGMYMVLILLHALIRAPRGGELRIDRHGVTVSQPHRNVAAPWSRIARVRKQWWRRCVILEDETGQAQLRLTYEELGRPLLKEDIAGQITRLRVTYLSDEPRDRS